MMIGTFMGPKDLSDPWTNIAQFTPLEEKAPDGHMPSGERLTRKQFTSRTGHLRPKVQEVNGKECLAEGEAKVVESKALF